MENCTVSAAVDINVCSASFISHDGWVKYAHAQYEKDPTTEPILLPEEIDAVKIIHIAKDERVVESWTDYIQESFYKIDPSLNRNTGYHLGIVKSRFVHVILHKELGRLSELTKRTSDRDYPVIVPDYVESCAGKTIYLNAEMIEDNHFHLFKEYIIDKRCRTGLFFDDIETGNTPFRVSTAHKSGQPFLKYKTYSGLRREIGIFEFFRDANLSCSPSQLALSDSEKQNYEKLTKFKLQVLKKRLAIIEKDLYPEC